MATPLSEERVLEIDPLIEAILKAAGSSLRHYMPKSKEDIRSAASNAIDEILTRRAADSAEVTEAARDVLAERERQKTIEGWTPEHDDDHRGGQMAAAAAAYAWHASLPDHKLPSMGSPDSFLRFIWRHIWPSYGTAYGAWDDHWWKPTNRRRNLVKAGALILAEIERLDRARSQHQEQPHVE